jgi:hypothetical protein
MVRVCNAGQAQIILKTLKNLLRGKGIIVSQAELAEFAILDLTQDRAAELLADRSAAA